MSITAQIIKAAEQFHGHETVDWSERCHEVARMRRAVWWALKKRTDLKLTAIAHCFGGQSFNHSTVAYAIKMFQHLTDTGDKQAVQWAGLVEHMEFAHA